MMFILTCFCSQPVAYYRDLETEAVFMVWKTEDVNLEEQFVFVSTSFLYTPML